jgi:hypothetical protein
MLMKLLSGALAAAALLPQAAVADVTYTYAGATFDNVNVLTLLDAEVPPEVAVAQSAAARAVLLNDRIGITLTTPVYMPSGWTSIDSTGIYGELAAPLGPLQAGNPGAGVTWSLTNSAFGGDGHIQLDNLLSFDPWTQSRLTVSLHVGAGNAIDAWEISMLPGQMYGPPNWEILMTSSSANGDSLLYEFGAAHGYQRRVAATATIGGWTVSGSPVAAVPEPGLGAMLLAGLAAVAAAATQRKRA